MTRGGIEQNLLARPDALTPCGVEIAAGERRQRAVGLLVDGLTVQVPSGEDANGRPLTRGVLYQVSEDYPLPVRVWAMSDAELIEVATLENSLREEMTPLEQADAYLALIGAGRSAEYIAARYGQHPNTVKSRLQLAAGLGREGRKLLGAGEITLEQARIIAATSGALKKSLTEQARFGAGVSLLRHLVRSGAFVVENAVFDVEGSGLKIDEGGLLGEFPAKFADARAALSVQVKALNALKAQEEQGQAQWAGVSVVPVESESGELDSREWASAYQVPTGLKGHLVLTYSTRTGRHQRCEGVARWTEVQGHRRQQTEAQAQARREAQPGQGDVNSAAQAAALPKVRVAAHEIGQQTRCQALDGHLAAHPQMCLALACQSLIQGLLHASHRNLMGLSVQGRAEVPMTEEGQALGIQVAGRFPLLFEVEGAGQVSVRRRAGLDVLVELTAEGVGVNELLAVFAYLTHRQVAAWDSAERRPTPEVIAFAVQVGAVSDVINRFTLSAAYLSAYTLDGLHVLIQTMPQAAQPAGAFRASKRELVALILEKAPALKAAGWLPDLVQFK